MIPKVVVCDGSGLQQGCTVVDVKVKYWDLLMNLTLKPRNIELASDALDRQG